MPTAPSTRPSCTSRLQRALKLRDRLIGAPFYRLVHAEADGFPGCIIDRFGDVVVVEPNSAGADRLIEPLVAALDRLLKPRTIVVSRRRPRAHARRTGAGASHRQGHARRCRSSCRSTARASWPISPGGQKTGWFYDQRDNRAAGRALRQGRRRARPLLPTAAASACRRRASGAKSVLSVDRSQPALDLARRAAALNGVADRACDGDARKPSSSWSRPAPTTAPSTW